MHALSSGGARQAESESGMAKRKLVDDPQLELALTNLAALKAMEPQTLVFRGIDVLEKKPSTSRREELRQQAANWQRRKA